MGVVSWLDRFKTLHRKAGTGALAPQEAVEYQTARDELARALLAAQRLSLPQGLAPRRSLRVARALQADLEFDDGSIRALTLDVSAGGFATKLAKPPRPGEEPMVSLRVPGGEPIRARARVLDAKAEVGTTRVSFSFIDPDPETVERLERFVFDALLDQIQDAPAAGPKRK